MRKYILPLLLLLFAVPVDGHNANSIERSLDRNSTIVSPLTGSGAVDVESDSTIVGPLGSSGGVAVEITGPTTAFGELVVAEPTPIIQLQFAYNLNSRLVAEHNNSGGSTSIAQNMVALSTGAGANQSSEIHSIIPIKYNTGQGGLFRGTAIFTTGVANSEQLIGVGDSSDGFFFGYDGSAFGVLRRHSGSREIQTLTITTKSSSVDNITITLDGETDTTVAVTNGADTTVTANEIAANDYSNVGLGWHAQAVGPTVVFWSWDSESKSGAFTLSNANEAVGTFAETVDGASAADVWVVQSSWSEDVMDGSGGSGMTLDTTKGNVYQIRYQWLGFGMIRFYIEDSVTGMFKLVHKIQYANANTDPSIDNPTLPIYLRVGNTSNTSDIVLKTASLAGFIEGNEEFRGPSRAETAFNTSVGTTIIPILSIRNKIVYQGKLNRVKIRQQILSLATDATNIIKFRLLLDPVLIGSSWSDVDTNTSVAQVDTSATSCTGGIELLSIDLTKTDSELINISNLNAFLLPGNHITITAQAVAGSSNQDVTVSNNFMELF